MLRNYQLEPLLEDQVVRWDELIASYPNRYLYHRKAWLDYISASQNAEIRFWAIREGSRTVGYFSGGVIRKGPYRILGSPLKGWCTNFMGPVFSEGFDEDAFFRAIDALALAEGFAMVEIEQPALSKDAFQRRGFEPVCCPNLVVRLEPGHPERMWERLDSKVRTKVRKAKRLGLTAELTTDPGIAEIYYEQFLGRLVEKTYVPPYGPETPRLLCEYLMPHDLILALRVRDPKGRTIATALYPHDGQTLYGWGRSSRSDAWEFCPNEYVQWMMIELAASRGLKYYNMCSYGEFFGKFGGDLGEVTRWHKFYSQTARFARTGYEIFHRQQIRLRGWWKNVSEKRSELGP
jgi:hypothetical protein